MIQLTLEQSFQLKVLQDQIQTLDEQQAKEMLIEVFKQMMMKDNLYKQMFKEDFPNS